MKILHRLGALAAAAALLAPSVSRAAEGTPQYVGVEACGKCHKRDRTGNQLKQWQESRHAGAYATLGTERAAAVANEAGLEGSPQESPECLRCHVAAYGVDAALIVAPRPGKNGFQITDGIQCETCHGPGSLYKSRKVMKDHEASVAAGLILPDESLCVTCHNEQSPTYQAFNFEERVKKVQHPIPGSEGAQ